MASGKALVITSSGGNEVFQIVNDFKIPMPADGEVIIKNVATSVNPVDIYVRSGMYASPTFPKVIGGDIAGHIYAVAEGSKFAVGDAVYALSDTYVPYSKYEGSYAEYVLVKEDWIARAPSTLSLKESAGVPLVYLTALQALERSVPIPGQRILVLGGSGAVGQFGIQLAKIVYNLHVTAVSSSHNFELVKNLGADEVWDYANGAAGLESDFQSRKFDIVFDVIGGDLLDASAKVLVDGGVITHIMNRGTNGADQRYKAAAESGIGPKFEITLVQPNGPDLQKAAELFDSGKLTIKIAKEFPLENAVAAHDLVIDGHAGGKVILVI